MWDRGNKIRVLKKNSTERDTVRLKDRSLRESVSGEKGSLKTRDHGTRYLQIIPRPSKQDFFLCSSLLRRHSLLILDSGSSKPADDEEEGLGMRGEVDEGPVDGAVEGQCGREKKCERQRRST